MSKYAVGDWVMVCALPGDMKYPESILLVEYTRKENNHHDNVSYIGTMFDVKNLQRTSNAVAWYPYVRRLATEKEILACLAML